VLGICLGHQAICTFFGATLINLQYPMHGKKTKLKIYKSKKNIFSGIQDKIITGRYHSWVVSEKNFPDCLEITSVSGEGHIMSVAHKNYNITGIQFHPESYMTNTSLQILKNWINME
jgi:anthranilate synthase/aminodeoxychorismate synthase-like glutamine amidotransferase